MVGCFVYLDGSASSTGFFYLNRPAGSPGVYSERRGSETLGRGLNFQENSTVVNPLDAGRRLTDFAQTSYAAGSLLTDCTVYERSG